MAYGPGGSAAPYRPRKRQRKPLTKIATGLKIRKPKPTVPKMAGGGVVAPRPMTTEPVTRYPGRNAKKRPNRNLRPKKLY